MLLLYLARMARSIILEGFKTGFTKLSDETNGFHTIIGLEDVEKLADVLMTLQLLQDLSLAKGIEKNTIAIVECIHFALFDSDYP